MEGRQTVTKVFATAVAVALLSGFVMVMQAWAAGGSVSVTSGGAEPGGTGTVDVVGNVDGPGLGAWTIDIVYDPTVVTAVDCDAHPAGVCNPDLLDLGNTVRMTGAVASGLDEETVLGTIEFECGDAEGATDLVIVVNVFADATIGDPQVVDPLDVSDGSFACVAGGFVPSPTPEPTPLPLVVPGAQVAGNASAGASYEGPIAGGGTIRVTVSDDGLSVTSIELTRFLTYCNVITRQFTIDPSAPIIDDFFVEVFQAGPDQAPLFISVVGQFLSDGTVQGTVTTFSNDPQCEQQPRLFVASQVELEDTATTESVSEVLAIASEAELPDSGSDGGGLAGGNGKQWLLALLAAAGVLLLLAGSSRVISAAVATSPSPRLSEGSGLVDPVSAGHPGASGAGSNPHWLLSAREELSRLGLASVEEFGPRRRSRRR